jgi:hypothetical protein
MLLFGKLKSIIGFQSIRGSLRNLKSLLEFIFMEKCIRIVLIRISLNLPIKSIIGKMNFFFNYHLILVPIKKLLLYKITPLIILLIFFKIKFPMTSNVILLIKLNQTIIK